MQYLKYNNNKWFTSNDIEITPNIILYFGQHEDELFHIDSYFDAVYDSSWLNHPLAFRILEDICGCKKINGNALTVRSLFDENELVTISPTDLSTGVKALLVLLNEPDEFVSITRCGDNCSKWIGEISRLHPIHVSLNYCMSFDVLPENIIVENNHCLLESIHDYLKLVGIYCYEQTDYDNLKHLADTPHRVKPQVLRDLL